jgi:hypothetical protein
MDPLFDALLGGQLGAAAGFGPGLQGAMGQMWQVNQANQQAELYNAGLQQQMDMLNAQLAAAQNMQSKQLGQSQQNQALSALAQLANTKQLGGVLSNMFGGLTGAMGGLFGGLGSALGGGALGGPLNMHSNSGAGISFGAPGGGSSGGSSTGGGAGGYSGSPIAAGYDPSSASTPMTGGRNISNPNAYGGGFHMPAPLGSVASSARMAFAPGSPSVANDPTSVLLRALQGGTPGGSFGLA